METKENTTQYLEYRFTPEEKAELAQNMARAVGVKTDAELRLKEISSQIKAEIAAQDTIVNDRAGKLSRGYEYRNVECTITWDFEAGTYRVIRNDTGTVIEDRPLRQIELQLAMAT